jgi:hypothetical protein
MYWQHSLTTGIPLPDKLTPEGHQHLVDHFGCFKCQKIYADHHASKCDPVTNLHEDNWAPKTHEELDNLWHAFCEEHNVEYYPVMVVAVIGEEVGDAVLEDAIESPSDECIPLPIDMHLWWHCRINGDPTPAKALIDHGAPTAMISHKLATKLGLHLFPLQQLILLGSPLGLQSSSLENIAHHSVCLPLSSLDGWWTAHVITAVVVPQLHLDLILGMNFLALNKIVVDAKHHSVIAKDTGYDLLNPQPVLPVPPILMPKQHHTQLLWDFTSYHQEHAAWWHPVLVELQKTTCYSPPHAAQAFSFALLEQRINDPSGKHHFS